MLAFCGQDKCVVDMNGRLKLSSRFIADFTARGNGDVVLHCLPEGALAVYPEDVYAEIRRKEDDALSQLGNSLLMRRSLRRFGAMSLPDRITSQGRITIPPVFRELVALEPGSEVYVIGAEVGVEIWNAERWQLEMQNILQHQSARGAMEMETDLSGQHYGG